ncbi:MAG TPA: hypothetical protein VN679_15395 [Candidatus Acidoferrales bacterium]|nr:hypothetical protein [Candidatus Acidoferrales bacterium]
MALPAAQQARLDALSAADKGDAPPAQAPAAPTPALTPVPSAEDRVQGESVTVTRGEFNELQAAAGRVRAAEGRVESLEMDKEALEARLTALENASKGSGQGQGNDAPPANDEDWQPSQVQFTEDEQRDYGESREFVEKVVIDTLNKVLPKALAGLKGVKGKLTEIEQAVTKTVKHTEQIEGRDFNDQVRQKLAGDKINFDDVVNHQHWVAFAESEDPNTGYLYADVIRGGLQNRKVEVVVRVFKDFAKKYGIGERPSSTGYEGGLSGGGSRVPEGNDEPEMLPFSKRKEAHKQWINKQISDSEYQRIRDAYEKAEKEGRLDYNA